jgi:hypothetical protein
MSYHVALVRTDDSVEHIASIIMVRTTLAVTMKRSTLRGNIMLLVNVIIVPDSHILVILMMEAIPSPVTSVHTRATQCNIPEDDILHSHRSENLKSYIILTG